MKKGLILGLILTTLIGTAVFAAAYSAAVTVTETGGSNRIQQPISFSVNNTDLASDGFIIPSGLDTRITEAGTELPHMVADNKTLFATNLLANQQHTYSYTTGNDNLTDFYIVTGHNGYITVSDDATLELGDNFIIEFSGYINTSSNGTLVDKGIFSITNTAGNITTAVAGGDFPVITELARGNNAVDSVNHTVNITDGVTSGDLLLVLFSSDGAPAVTFPSGWTLLSDDTRTSTNTLTTYYRFANGTEGASILVTTNVTEQSAHHTYRITGVVAEFSPEIEVFVGGASSNSPNPPELSPSWGAMNTLWLAVYGCNDNELASVYPTGYTDGRSDRADTVQGCGIGSARRNRNIASENPGTFTITASQGWIAVTIAVIGGVSVTASGVSSGDVIITTTANITHLLTAVDNVTQDTTALTANVTNNSENYTFLQENVMPYADNVTVTINGTQQLWFQPNTMVIGTNLPNRGSASINGTIVWGNNPGYVTLALGALLPDTQSSATVTTEGEVPDFVPVTDDDSMITTGVEGEGFPLYQMFKDLLAQWAALGGPNITMPYFWKVVAVVIGWCAGTAVMLSTKNIFLGLVAYCLGFAIPAGAMGGVLDLWIPITYGLGALFICLLLAKWNPSSI